LSCRNPRAWMAASSSWIVASPNVARSHLMAAGGRAPPSDRRSCCGLPRWTASRSRTPRRSSEARSGGAYVCGGWPRNHSGRAASDLPASPPASPLTRDGAGRPETPCDVQAPVIARKWLPTLPPQSACQGGRRGFKSRLPLQISRRMTAGSKVAASPAVLRWWRGHHHLHHHFERGGQPVAKKCPRFDVPNSRGSTNRVGLGVRHRRRGPAPTNCRFRAGGATTDAWL
jgi:hypothetical protein